MKFLFQLFYTVVFLLYKFSNFQLCFVFVFLLQIIAMERNGKSQDRLHSNYMLNCNISTGYPNWEIAFLRSTWLRVRNTLTDHQGYLKMFGVKWLIICCLLNKGKQLKYFESCSDAPYIAGWSFLFCYNISILNFNICNIC